MNYRTNKLLLVLLLTLFSLFLVYLVIVFKFNLNEIQSLFSIIGSISIGVALLTYFYKKKQDELLATVDQITFFRKEIISEWYDVKKKLNNKDSEFIFSRIDLQNPDIDYIKKEFSVNFSRQLRIFFDASGNNPDVWLDGTILDNHISLLNMLEEFSLRVLHSKTEQNPAIESIRNAFVEIVEQNAVALLFVRDVKSGKPTYSAVLTLYNLWQKNTSKTNFVKNLGKYGLITKKQKDEVYKKRKEKIGF